MKQSVMGLKYYGKILNNRGKSVESPQPPRDYDFIPIRKNLVWFENYITYYFLHECVGLKPHNLKLSQLGCVNIDAEAGIAWSFYLQGNGRDDTSFDSEFYSELGFLWVSSVCPI